MEKSTIFEKLYLKDHQFKQKHTIVSVCQSIARNFEHEMTTIKKNTKLADLIDYRLRVITVDGRDYIGELMAFDKHMNLILKNCVEERIPKSQKSGLKLNQGNLKKETRTLGLIVLRGENIISTTVEDKPTLTKKERLVVKNRQIKKINKKRNQKKSENKTDGTKLNNKLTAMKKFQPPQGFNRT